MLEPQKEVLKVPLLSQLALTLNLDLNLEFFLKELYQVLEEMYDTPHCWSLPHLHPRRRGSCHAGESLKTRFAVLFTMTVDGWKDTISTQ